MSGRRKPRPLSPGQINVMTSEQSEISNVKGASTVPFAGDTDIMEGKSKVMNAANEVRVGLVSEEITAQVYLSTKIPSEDMPSRLPSLAYAYLLADGSINQIGETAILVEVYAGVDFYHSSYPTPSSPTDMPRVLNFHQFYGVVAESNMPQPGSTITVVYLDDNPRTTGMVKEFSGAPPAMIFSPNGATDGFGASSALFPSSAIPRTYGHYACKDPNKKYSSKSYVGAAARGSCGALSGAKSLSKIVNGTHSHMMWSPKKRLGVPMEKRQWGHPILVDSITRAVEAAYRTPSRTPYHKFYIGDVSYKSGGYLDGHLSHQMGLDIDTGFFMRFNATFSEGQRHKPPPGGIDLKNPCHWARRGKRQKFVDFMNKYFDVERNSAFVISLAEQSDACYALWCDGWIIWYMQQRAYNPNFFEKVKKYSASGIDRWVRNPKKVTTHVKPKKRQILSHLAIHYNHYHIRFSKKDHAALSEINLKSGYKKENPRD